MGKPTDTITKDGTFSLRIFSLPNRGPLYAPSRLSCLWRLRPSLRRNGCPAEFLPSLHGGGTQSERGGRTTQRLHLLLQLLLQRANRRSRTNNDASSDLSRTRRSDGRTLVPSHWGSLCDPQPQEQRDEPDSAQHDRGGAGGLQ